MIFLSLLSIISVFTVIRSSDVCVGRGESCLTVPESCCDDLKCDPYHWVCEYYSPWTISRHTPSRCLTQYQQCDEDGECCSDLICSANSGVCETALNQLSMPCIQRGKTCVAASHGCCSGLNCVGNDEDWTCQGESPQCKQQYAWCGSMEDCCSGLTCSGGYCDAVPTPSPSPPCIDKGQNCVSASHDCCGGLDCVEDLYQQWTCQRKTPPHHCKKQYSPCGSDKDCCSGLTCSSGYCEADPTPSPTPPCIQRGQNCVTASHDCCSGLDCVGNDAGWTCQGKPTPPPHCKKQYSSCGSDDECCPGLTCSDGSCDDAPTPPPSPPCFQKGQGCLTQPEACCSGLSCKNVVNDWTCLPDPTPPRPPCKHKHSSCGSDEDCCCGLTCSDGSCEAVPTPSPSGPCISRGQSCLTAAHGCCRGLRCDGDTWKCVNNHPIPTSTTPPTPAPHPSCQPIDAPCLSDEDCCSRLTCSGGSCEAVPTPSPSGPCIARGQSCLTAAHGCCRGLRCDGDSWKCVNNHPIPTSTTPPTPAPHPSCQPIHTPCDPNILCCSDLMCSDDGMCTSSPPEPSSCIEQGFSCVEYECCSGLKCGTDSYLCLPY